MYILCRLTGETLDRIFLSLKSQFANFEYRERVCFYTEQQIDKIIKETIMSKFNYIIYYC